MVPCGRGMGLDDTPGLISGHPSCHAPPVIPGLVAASTKASTFTMAQCASELLHEQVTNIEELVRVMPFSAVREMLEAAPAEAMAG